MAATENAYQAGDVVRIVIRLVAGFRLVAEAMPPLVNRNRRKPIREPDHQRLEDRRVGGDAVEEQHQRAVALLAHVQGDAANVDASRDDVVGRCVRRHVHDPRLRCPSPAKGSYRLGSRQADCLTFLQSSDLTIWLSCCQISMAWRMLLQFATQKPMRRYRCPQI